MRSEFDEDEADDLHDPDESDMDSGDEPELVACPQCGKNVNEDAERCHHCGSHISLAEIDARKPSWLVFAIVVALLTFAVVIFRGVFR
ncbi:MAG TPA: hypothetical protein VH518_01005 [Tepidisphaeraceae bacterium]